MTTQTKTGEYLRKMAQGGHFKQKLGETALALTELHCKADISRRRMMGNLLADEMQHVLHQVYGWTGISAKEAGDQLREAFSNTDLGGES